MGAQELALDDRPADLMGVRACAKALTPPVSASTISRQLGAGLFTNWGTESLPLISLTEVRAKREQNLSPAQQRRPAERAAKRDDGGYHSARAAREQAAAQIAQLDLAERLGQLLRRDQVEDEHATLGRATREALTQMARRVMPAIDQAEGTEAKIAVLTQAIEAELNRLADGYEAEGDGTGPPSP